MIVDQLSRAASMFAAVSAPAAADDRWYSNATTMSKAGAAVTPDSALQVDAFFSCLRVIAETMGYTPWFVYKRLANGGRDRAPEHPLYSLLHDQPNPWQTAFEWKEMMAGHIILRGHAYNKIVPGPNGPFDQLLPLNPDRTTIEVLPSGAQRYRYINPQGQTEILAYDEVFHIPGLWGGKSILEAARENLGEALAAQDTSSNGLRNRFAPPGALITKAVFKDENALKRLSNQFADVYLGPANNGKPLILEGGMEWQQLGLTNRDAQFIETRQLGVPTIARRFRMPLTMIGYESGTSNFGTGVEQYQIGFVVFTMLPWFGRFESRGNMDLMVDPQTYYTEFEPNAMLRGDAKSLNESLAIEMMNGALSPDEWRILKNRNPIPNGDGQMFFRQANTIPLGQVETRITETVTPGQTSKTGARVDPRAARLAGVLARSIVNRETHQMAAMIKRHRDDGLGFEAKVREFYAEMAQDIEKRCMVAPEVAQGYADRWCATVLPNAASVVEGWEEPKTAELTELILGGE